MKKLVGGGAKKVLYTLNTVRRIGLINSARALNAKNTCKACGLGMGGQMGGMTNELGEFPAVCNKSIQAQSTDIQPPIPVEIFKHPLSELRELSAHELEHAGRLGHPIFKEQSSQQYRVVEWGWALDYAAKRFSECEPNRSFFYSSGRSSNEAGFLLQLLARLYGTNNVNNCSYYCHQATSVGLGSTIGTGTSTVELQDLTGCDLIFVIGANPASNHPRFIHMLKNCRDRGGQVIVINPAKEPGLVKFAVPKSAKSMLSGGTDIASLYLQPNIGSDIALFKGLAKAIIETSTQDTTFLRNHCEGYAEFLNDIESTDWESIESTCGISCEAIQQAAAMYGKASHAVFAWGMGMTHHRFGSDNVEYIANLALLRGMVGKRHAGLLPLRGHSNVQGIGTIGVKPVLTDDVFDRMEQSLNVKMSRAPGYDTFRGLQAAHDGEIDCACMVGGNLYSATPHAQWAETAMNRIGFKLFLTTTLNFSHLYGVDDGDTLVLPVMARDEETQSTTQESMFNYVRLSDGGIERLANVRSEVSILAELGQRLLPDSGVNFESFANHDTIRKSIVDTVPGMQQLKDISVARQEFHVHGRLLHAPEFKTPDQKARLVVRPIPNANDDPEHYPFLLASVRSEGQFNTMIYEETDCYRHDAPRRSVLMSAADMAAMHLITGDRVNLVSRIGRMENVQVQAFDLSPGNLLAYFPEANALTEHQLDPRSKTPNFKSVPVKVEKSSKVKN